MVNTILLADSIYIAAGRLASWATKAGFALTEAESVDAARLTGSVDRLEAAVEAAIERDRAESWVLIDELQAIFREGLLGYWPGRKDFEAQGEAWFSQFRDRARVVRNIVTAVQGEAGSVPARLEASASDWSVAATAVEGISGRINAVRAIPGWAGGASGGYSRRTVVQDGATQELRGMATSMANALSQIALFNRALFLYMDREIASVTAAVQGLQKGSGHYARSINGTSILRTLARNLDKAQNGEPVQSVAEELQTMVNKCLEAPQLLAPGVWPTGGGQAEVPPAETDAVVDPDADTVVEDAGAVASSVSDGLER